MSLPHWAAWLAQDAGGEWWAYEAMPNEAERGWYENEVGRCLRLVVGEANVAWRDSLMSRSAFEAMVLVGR